LRYVEASIVSEKVLARAVVRPLAWLVLPEELGLATLLDTWSSLFASSSSSAATSSPAG
jgi:hypothetical protein